jgi:hypothetical protein
MKKAGQSLLFSCGQRPNYIFFSLFFAAHGFFFAAQGFSLAAQGFFLAAQGFSFISFFIPSLGFSPAMWAAPKAVPLIAKALANKTAAIFFMLASLRCG